MNLYRIDTERLQSFFVVANDPTEAEKALINLLNTADYGFSKDRQIKSIHFISQEVRLWNGSKPNFTELNRLILPTSCR